MFKSVRTNSFLAILVLLLAGSCEESMIDPSKKDAGRVILPEEEAQEAEEEETLAEASTPDGD